MLTQIQSYTLPPDKLILAENFAFARHVLYFASLALSLIVLLALIHFRIAPRLRKQKLPIVIAAIYAIITLFDLPADAGFHALSLQYGISIQPWPSWLVDWLKAQAVSLPVVVLVGWAFYILVRRSPRRWWLYAWAACIPLILFTAWIEPYVIEPLFNDFAPLSAKHPELVAPIEALLGRAGVTIPSDHLFEMRASAKTNALNAYVSGFGSSKRVVLYDTIIEKEPQPELMTTFGHELGHYVLGHIAKGIAYSAVGLFAGFFLAYVLINWFVSKWGLRFDVPSPRDAGSMPVFALIVFLLSFFAEPISNVLSRMQEHQADQYSLDVTAGLVRDNGQVAARAFQIEGESGLEPPDPSPFIVLWLYSHPPVRDRIDFSVHYTPKPIGN